MQNVNLCFINGRKLKKGEKVPSVIELRLTYQRKVKYISTGIKVLPSEFKNERVVKRGDAFSLNAELDELRGKVSRIVRDMVDADDIDLESVKERLRVHGTTITFWEYIEQRKEEKTGISEQTRKRYDVFLKKIKEFGLFRCFSDITERNIRRFDEKLHGEGLSQSTIGAGYHKLLKMFIADAVMDGHLKEHIYHAKRISFSRGEGAIDKYLDEDELAMIESKELTDLTLDRVRDVFVFACYTGLSYSDLARFGKDDIVEVDGVKMVVGDRVKTGKEYMFVLLDPAVRILEKYNYRLPIISNQKYNDYLKLVALACGVEKRISSHWARHTAAMLMLNNGVPIEIVAKVLGHSNIKTTQQSYARIRQKAVAREMTEYAKRIAR